MANDTVTWKGKTLRKDFLPYETVRNNSLRLACSIHQSGFVPDIIYVLLRGGAYLGNVMSEYFKIVRKNERPVFYAAVVARSYTNVGKPDRVMVDGWTYSPEYLRNGDKVLLVDDIFDSGRTINYLAEIILARGIPREDLKIAVHDYKVFRSTDPTLLIHPDFYCRRHEIDTPDDDVWIHYMSHELEGLTESEIDSYYPHIDRETRSLLIRVDAC